MRNAFISELITLAESNDNIVLIVGDLGYSVVEPFVECFPNRFINAGVAEQNMMGLAAGMASEGCHVFVYSIANFPTFRCAEQVRNDVDYHQLPVTIVTVGSGLTYGNLGYSHHAVQDYALMRIFPNMLIAAPGDPIEVRACLRYLALHPQPSYLRLGKVGESSFHSQIPDISPGQWLPLFDNEVSDKTFLTTGATLAMVASWIKHNKFQEYALYSLPLWGMAWKKTQVIQFKRWKKVITVEDHLVDGGFGSWLRESLDSNPELMAHLSTRALDSRVCGMVGRQETLNRLGNLEFSELLEPP